MVDVTSAGVRVNELDESTLARDTWVCVPPAAPPQAASEATSAHVTVNLCVVVLRAMVMVARASLSSVVKTSPEPAPVQVTETGEVELGTAGVVQAVEDSMSRVIASWAAWILSSV